MNVYDWRRENVNTLIRELGDIIREKNSAKDVKCAFGISPAARWAPTVEVCSSEPYRGAEGGMSGSCNNYYSYSDLFADTYKWAKEGWIDYIVPQNYTNLAGDYGTIMKWWSDALKGYPVKLYVGTALYQVSNSWGDSGVLEMYYQLRYNQTKDFRIDGYFLFSYSSMVGKMGANAMKPIAQYAWKYASLTPLYDAYTYEKEVKEKSVVEDVTIDEENKVTVDYKVVEGAKGYGVYKAKKGESVSFDIKNLVTRVINPNKDIEFVKDDQYDYYLVTFDNDNTIYADYELIRLESEMPTVSVSLDKEEYYSSSEVEISLNIVDPDNDSHNVTILYAPDGLNYINTVCEGLVSQNAKFKYVLPKVNKNGSFLVIVKDGLNTVETKVNIQIGYALPDVNISFDKDSYKTGDTVGFTVTIEDIDSENFSLNILYAADGVNYTEEVFPLITDITKDPISLSYILSSGSNNSKFKVIIADKENTVAKEFNVNVSNSAPTVTVNKVSNSSVGNKIVIPVTVSDAENDSMTYTVYVAYDGSNYSQVSTGVITGNVTIIEVDASSESSNALVKVVVNDGSNSVEAVSNSFTVEGSKKGCGCGSSQVMFEVLAIITLLAFVLRKREK